jgi:flagellar basal body L-ring protein FlgH
VGSAGDAKILMEGNGIIEDEEEPGWHGERS